MSEEQEAMVIFTGSMRDAVFSESECTDSSFGENAFWCGRGKINIGNGYVLQCENYCVWHGRFEVFLRVLVAH